ncbi:Gfo/Idh/MocA family oxidoreductase [Candidatus Sumerlaeota bacterium]|nr:Gfo/Idh/MocA family oxidoreductase [Candidatus Sumerlaeota bacterium]
MEKVRIAVIGVGRMGQHHARILAENPHCELVAIVDRSRERAERVAQQYGCEGLKRYRKIYEMVDAVCIAVPTSLHHKVAGEFLQRGIHCMVEKPITTTVDEAEDLIRLAEEKDCVLQVGHIERYNAAVRRLREILDKPGFIECHRMGPFDPRVSDVGVVLDLMIHDIDIVLQLVRSPIASMEALGVNILTDKEDLANLRIRFESGCTANLTVSRVSPRKQRKIRVFQKDTYVSIDYDKQSMELYQRVPRPNPKKGEPAADIVRKRVRLAKEDKIALELDDFLQTILQGRKPSVTGQSARDALHVAVETARMIAENKTIERFT